MPINSGYRRISVRLLSFTPSITWRQNSFTFPGSANTSRAASFANNTISFTFAAYANLIPV